MKANYKINITGTYNENGITLNGTITGATWQGVKNINFNFDETGSSIDENTGSETERMKKTQGKRQQEMLLKLVHCIRIVMC